MAKLGALQIKHLILDKQPVIDVLTLGKNQTVKTGSVLVKDTEGNFKACDGTAPEGAYAICLEDKVTAAEVTAPVSVLLWGEVNGDLLVIPSGKTIKDYKEHLRKIGIFVKREQ